MLERTFYLAVGSKPSFVIIEAGVDNQRVHSVDQVDLNFGQLGTIDGEGFDTNIPQCYCINSAFD